MNKYFVFAMVDEDIYHELCSYPENRVDINDSTKVYRILSRDCRSDDTKEFIAQHNKRAGVMKLFKKGRHYEYDRIISDEILKKKIISTGTSTYELQEDWG